MRPIYPLAGILLMTGAPFAVAQQTPSLCNPCVDPPLFERGSGGIRTPSTTTIITAEDMRDLGIVSVADMIAQLPGVPVEGSAAKEDEEPREADQSATDAETKEASAEE